MAEILSVEDDRGTEILDRLDDDTLRHLEDVALEQAADDDQTARDEAADARRDYLLCDRLDDERECDG